MTYTAGVFDRTLADILARNSKAFLNVADWTRIYDNALYIIGLYETMLGRDIPSGTVGVPTTATIVTAANVNILCSNIDNLRATTGTPVIAGVVAIKTDWLGGIGSQTPTYEDVNKWEKNLDLEYTYVNGQLNPTRTPRTGVALTGSGMTRQNSFRG